MPKQEQSFRVATLVGKLSINSRLTANEQNKIVFLRRSPEMNRASKAERVKIKYESEQGENNAASESRSAS